MGELIDFFLGNIFFLVIVIGALLRLFSGNSNQNKEEQRKTQQNRPRQQTNPRPSTSPSRANTQRDVKTNTTASQSISVEEQQKQQLEKLAGRMNTKMEQSIEDLSTNTTDLGETLKRPKKEATSLKEEDYRKRIKGNLSRDGLVNSVIMAEVLGAPRARKPYRSVISERNK
ncbi:hypothetical protein GMD78_01550 [Ornithinibacillus sp. L9]|uniref:Uncharacterized protein n=1 Tax=Ornithinibacillus caprae TaxID=2678566 RepID=A0A6N8FIE3_9BACI|nr:hypothetical protein [Ornithinibacillus caprae]MUK87088.1 hypothetical protein [Ornithinibacillus caprae]